MEEWKPLHDYNNYTISDHGRVRSERSGAVLAVNVTQQGRAFVKLMQGERQVGRGLALLVCEAFIPLPSRVMVTPTPIHVDGDLMNCRADNLLWRPRWFAQRHSRQFRVHQGHVAPIRIIDTGVVYDDAWDIVYEYGVLYDEVILAAANGTRLYPTWHRLEWANPH